MPLIQCKLGGKTVEVAGTSYTFHRDRAGRFVTPVTNHRHAECLLAVEHYARVDPLPEPEEPKVQKVKEPKQVQPPAPPAPTGQKTDGDDDAAAPTVTSIKGIGEKLVAKLAEKGVATLADIANMTPETEARLDVELKLHGRIQRDDWIGQANALLAPPATTE